MIRREWFDPSECPETGVGMRQHGPADQQGRCPWCGRAYVSPTPPAVSSGPSELAEAYGTFYDPDWSGLGSVELARRWRGGQGTW